MKTILILEDDVIFSRSIGNWLKKKGMATEHAATLSAARKALSAREFDLVLADLRLPDGNSTSLLEWMNERFYATPFLIMTNYGQVENAVEAMQLGAVNYLCKPVQPDRLLEAIGKIFSRPRHDGNEFYRGESAKAREMYQLVGLVARSDISVLIRGASGTGKEHIARELHEQSHRRDKPFVPVDCGTITGDLAKSEFFGHRKGTFTGAYGDRYGLFQVADGGTLFLDEIGELAVKGQLPDENAVGQVGGDESAQLHQRGYYRQVEHGAYLAHACRGEVHRDLPVKQLQLQMTQHRADTRLALLHGDIRHSNDIERRLTRRDARLNRHHERVQTEKSRAFYLTEHSYSLTSDRQKSAQSCLYHGISRA